MKKSLLFLLLLLSFLFTWSQSKTFAYYWDGCSSYWIMAYNDWYGSCKCRSGYIMSNTYFWTSCVSMSQYCQNKYGIMATSSIYSNSCSCSYWYVFSKDMFGNTSCQNGNSVCRSKHGLYSSYDWISKSCKCDSWYTFDSDYECVKKQNNVYFFLRELDTINRQAVIISNTTPKDYYLIRYWYWCYSISRYLNNFLVVNLWTDRYLDSYDKLLLYNHDETCSITSKTKVSSSYTLMSCSDLFWPYSIESWTNTCACLSGYGWNSDKSSCVSNPTSIRYFKWSRGWCFYVNSERKIVYVDKSYCE